MFFVQLVRDKSNQFDFLPRGLIDSSPAGRYIKQLIFLRVPFSWTSLRPGVRFSFFVGEF